MAPAARDGPSAASSGSYPHSLWTSLWMALWIAEIADKRMAFLLGWLNFDLKNIIKNKELFKNWIVAL